jgi:DNA polymerase-3 subunit alpha
VKCIAEAVFDLTDEKVEALIQPHRRRRSSEKTERTSQKISIQTREPSASASKQELPPPTAEIPSQEKQKLYIRIAADHEKKSFLQSVQNLLLSHHGQQPVFLYYERTGRVLKLDEKYGVAHDPTLAHKLETLLGTGSAKWTG